MVTPMGVTVCPTNCPLDVGTPMRRDPHGTSPTRPHPTRCPHPDVTRARCHHAVPIGGVTLPPKGDPIPSVTDAVSEG